ncbi:MAG: hypothetical protein OFPI_04220 [Osedax symbiont Rs2]|nr:MAG: hypothetical protein OFPI_04220 [Osedax symbiont Rs2]
MGHIILKLAMKTSRSAVKLASGAIKLFLLTSLSLSQQIE